MISDYWHSWSSGERWNCKVSEHLRTAEIEEGYTKDAVMSRQVPYALLRNDSLASQAWWTIYFWVTYFICAPSFSLQVVPDSCIPNSFFPHDVLMDVRDKLYLNQIMLEMSKRSIHLKLLSKFRGLDCLLLYAFFRR